MRLPLPFRASLLAIAASGLAAAAPARKGPDLRQDDTPVTNGAGGLVATYADVLAQPEKAVVSIESTRTVHEHIPVNPLLRQFFGDSIPEEQERDSKEEGLGSGVIVSSDGYILTNNHVVAGADSLTVTLADGREFPAKVVGADPKTDVAVVKIDAANLPIITLANSDRIRVGDIVFAVGNPLEIGETVTMGIVSAKGRQVGVLQDVNGYESFIQTDAAINLGNSGGALLDARGRLIGINSAIVPAPGSHSVGNIGIGFAVPVNLAVSVMRSLIATGTVSRGYLGVEFNPTDLTPDMAEQLGLPRDTKGALITDVVAQSPADKGGLKVSDVVTAANDQPITSNEDLHYAIGQMAPGAKVVLKVFRDGKPLKLNVTLGVLAEHPDELLAGVKLGPVDDDARRRFNIEPGIDGLVITDIAGDSPYADTLETGMVILGINRVRVTDLDTAETLVHPGRNLILFYDRGQHGYLTLTVAPPTP
jgi:serine protease Do/serine protease DegQ